MKSLKTRLVSVILIQVIFSSLLAVSICMLQNINTTNKVIHTLVEDRLASANNMLEIYLNEQFGPLRLDSSGKLTDIDNQSIEGQFEYIDRFAQEMDVVATLFAKDGDDFTRVLTTIKDSNGERAIGTKLDTTGPAYGQVSKGEVYLGEATILSAEYMTIYTPIFDSDNQIIGISFVGVPIESVNRILDQETALSIKSVIVTMIIVLVLAAVTTFFVSNRIARPIQKITVAAQEIAAGKFDVTLSVKSKDEIGQLAEAFNQTLRRLTDYQGYIDEISDALNSISTGDLTIELQREYSGSFKKLKVGMDNTLENLSSIMGHINTASDQVSAGSDQVAAGAQALSQGATEQASAVEELTATILGVSDDLNKSATNAHQAKQLSEEAGQQVVESNRQMQSLMVAMGEISKISHEINKIVKTIDDIAFQTNILALNAAVEAARAGAAGKGFAVVADEVRNLAGKSSESAKSTAQLIESTLSAIEEGEKLASTAAQSLHKVVEKARTVDAKVEEIASDIEKESVAVSQIATGIGQISAVVHTNSATAEESAAASEELAAQATFLKEQISKFKLKNEAYQPLYTSLDYDSGGKAEDSDSSKMSSISGLGKY